MISAAQRKRLNILLADWRQIDRMERGRLSKRWCVFAMVMLALVLPYETTRLFGHLSLYEAARCTVHIVAVLGILGYAFRVRVGPEKMWRVFAPFFILFSVIGIARGLPKLLAIPVSSTASLIGIAVLLCIVSAIPCFMSLALLRQGGWLEDARLR